MKPVFFYSPRIVDGKPWAQWTRRIRDQSNCDRFVEYGREPMDPGFVTMEGDRYGPTAVFDMTDRFAWVLSACRITAVRQHTHEPVFYTYRPFPNVVASKYYWTEYYISLQPELANVYHLFSEDVPELLFRKYATCDLCSTALRMASGMGTPPQREAKTTPAPTSSSMTGTLKSHSSALPGT